MAESNPTQVILTDDGLKIIKAQNTANEAVGNVNDINSDNKLTPSEKLKLKQEYDKDVELYNIDIEQLKSVDLPTAELETAMSNLTDFVTPLFKEMNRTSTVDRDALDSVFTAFATADKNASQAFVNMVQQVADDAKKAGDDAKEAGEKAQAAGEAASQAASQAQSDATQAVTMASQATSAADNAFSRAQAIGSQASSAIAVQSAATAKAQSTADSAFSQAKTAIDNGKVTSQAVTNLKDGSTLTIAELENGLASKVSNSDYATYKTQTANQIGQMVTNSNFSAYQQTTADLISSKVATKDFNTYTSQTAKAISSKVESSDFNTYKTQTDNTILSKVSKKDANNVNLVPYSAMPKANNLRWFETGGGGTLRAATHNFYHNSADPLYVLSTAGSNEVFAISPRFKINANTTYTFQLKGFASYNVSSMDVFVLGRKNGETKDYTVVNQIIASAKLSNSGLEYRTVTFTTGAIDEAYVRIDNNGSTDGKNSILCFTELKLEPGDTATPYVYGAEDTMISQMADDINLRVTKGDLIDQINIQAGKTLISSSGQLTLSGKSVFLDSVDPVIMKSANIANLAVGTAQIADGAINNAKIANLAINTAQIADGAINNAKIANASIDDAKINSLNGNKLVENSITANKINVDDLIANGINTKTLTSVNLNTSTLTTPQLDLGLNGTFTEDFDYTQPTSMFLPKKNKGNLTFNHGVLQSEGNMQTYVNGQWGGMNDSLVFQSGINNAQWTEVAPGYIKLDLYKQNGTDIAQRTYSDPTGFYYTSATGNKSYLGNVLQTGQVQSGSILGKYIGPMDGELRLQIGNNGDHYGLQVGSYAGSEAVMSDFIYSFTSSNSSNVRIADSGRLMRTTSASKYKYNIKNPDIEETLGDRLLNVRMATWNDKRAVDLYAEELNTGEEREKITIDKYYGLIAEQLRDAGLDMFVDYGKNHEIEGIQYDRAWIPLLSVVRRLNDKVNEYELRLSKLEGTNK